MIETKPHSTDLPAFDRNFWDGTFTFTRIGSGSLGGKAGALAFVKDLLAAAIDPAVYPGVEVNVPTMAVIATGCFTEFVRLRSRRLSRFAHQVCWKTRSIVPSQASTPPR